MENKNEDSNLNKQINTDFFKKSAVLRKKNNIVMARLRELKKLSEDFLRSVQKP